MVRGEWSFAVSMICRLCTTGDFSLRREEEAGSVHRASQLWGEFAKKRISVFSDFRGHDRESAFCGCRCGEPGSLLRWNQRTCSAADTRGEEVMSSWRWYQQVPLLRKYMQCPKKSHHTHTPPKSFRVSPHPTAATPRIPSQADWWESAHTWLYIVYKN